MPMCNKCRNQYWRTAMFSSRKVTSSWYVAQCILCEWHFAYHDTDGLRAVEAVLAQHLVEHHVDLQELQVC